LGLAFECEANVIVSSDEDLLVLDPWADTRILRPAEFLNELN
jgi:predicted nucleic acid-binding protein